MTLIEVLIATTLTMILLVAVTFFYRQMTILQRESEKLQKEQFQLSYLEKRLMGVIPKTLGSKSKDFYFYTSDELINGFQSLVFTYNNGVQMEAEYSGNCLGRIFVDHNNNLVLATWPLKSRSENNINLQMKKEILIENISFLSFEFYVPPKKDRGEMVKSSVKLTEIVPENSWHQAWNTSYNQLPPMIKIHIKLKNNDDTGDFSAFAFPLPNSDMVIFYEI